MRSLFIPVLLSLTTTVANANVVGVDTQNFNPTTSGLDFVTVQSSETLEPGVVNFGVFLNYAINTLPNYEDTVTQSRTKARDRLLSSDLNFGLGLMKNWDIGLSVPAVLNQEVEEDVFKGVFENAGTTDIRLNSKVRVYGDRDGGVAFVGTAEFPQIQDNPFSGTSNNPVYNLELAADTTVNKVALGFNVGYRFRDPGEKIPNIPIEPLGDMWIASVAGSYLFKDIDTKVISEIYGSRPAQSSSTQTDRELSTAEWLVGAKHDWSSALALHAGAATKLMHGTFSPDWRVYAGLNWSMGPLWGKDPVAQKSSVPVAVAKVQSENLGDEFLNAPQSAVQTVDVTSLSAGPGQAGYLDSRSPEARELFVVVNLNFTSGSSKIPQELEDYLSKFASYLQKPPMYRRIVITGHTDSVGADDMNLRLSRARALAAKNALVTKYKLDSKRIQVEGFGEERPVADNGNYQGRAQNRRVEFYIER